MVSTSGSQLLAREAIQVLRLKLLPLTTILTPNIPEAKLLLSDAGVSVKDPETVNDLVAMAQSLQKLGPRYVLVKGGHLPFTKDGQVARVEAEKDSMVDVLVKDGEVTCVKTGYQKSKNTHGTGCSLACK